MPDVRTTFQPGIVQTVSEQEYTDLDRQGLVLEVVTAKSKAESAKPKVSPGTIADQSKTK